MGRMNRRIILTWLSAILLVLSSSIAFGFDLSAGLKVGATFPCFSGPGYEDFLRSYTFQKKITIGFSGGAFITIGMFDFLAIQPEVFFSKLGGNSGDSYYTWKDKAQGFDIHALLKARIRAFRRATIDLFAGPGLFFKIGDVNVEVVDNSGNIVMTGYWINSNLMDPVIGLVLGAGLTVSMGSWFISVDGRYRKGLSSWFDPGVSGIREWYQDGFQLMVGTGVIIVSKRGKPSRVK